MNNVSPRRRAAFARFVVMAAATALAGCSLLLDWDLSGSGAGRGNPEEGGAPGDSGGDLLADGAPRDGATADRDGSTVPEAAVPLDCGGAQLCDDFEKRSDPRGPPTVGSWDGSVFEIGAASIVPNGAGAGVQSLLVDVPVNATGVVKDAYLGSNALSLRAAGTVTASFDVQLDYNPAAYADGDYHVIVEFGPPSGETVGVYYNKRFGGVFLVLTAFDGSGARFTVAGDDPNVALGNDLRGRFHHVEFEAVFSLMATKGGARVVVDNGAAATLGPLRTLATSVPPTYVATFGASSGPAGRTIPAMAARFDNIVVRSN